jgi:hypothetical protein
MIHLTQRFTVLPPSIFAHPCCLLPQQWYATVFFPFHPIIFCFEINSCFLPAGLKKRLYSGSDQLLPLASAEAERYNKVVYYIQEVFPIGYLYETHMHTCLASACGKSTGKEHVRRYRDLGFTGIIITDHFFGGNCAVPRHLPWDEKIRLFCAGFEDAWEEGQKVGLDVFFGWEQGYGDDEYLVYGLDKQWLLDHPEIEKCSRARQLALVHEGGGAVIQAHPFRMRDYMTYIRLGLSFADGAEVANAGNRSVHDTYAYHYAQEFGLVMTAGSDNHDSSRIQSQDDLFGVSLDAPLTSIQDYVQLIRSRGPIHLHVPDDRFSADPNTSEQLHSFWIDSYEHLIPTRRLWMNPFSPTDPE